MQDAEGDDEGREGRAPVGATGRTKSPVGPAPVGATGGVPRWEGREDT